MSTSPMERALPALLGYLGDVPRLAVRFGPLRGARIGVALVRQHPITFTDRSRTYVMPGGRSARYHLLHSIDKLRRLAAFVQADDRVIVDVGAHGGLFTAFALERAPGASAILVEPDPALLPIIERNAPGHRVVNAAFTDRVGEATLHRAESSQESTLFPGTAWSRTTPLTVPTTTLDEVCAEHTAIDVLKIDVQGAEHLVLAGGQRTLDRTRTLLIEVSLLDPEPDAVLNELRRVFGSWRIVNEVRAGADLALWR